MPTTSGANQSITFEIPGEAVPWSRAGRKNGQTFTPPRQRAHMGLITTIARRAMKDARLPLFSCPVSVGIRVIRTIPASFNKKARYEALLGKIWPDKRPDLGNFQKLIEDAMNKEVFDDDARICYAILAKVYGAEPKTIVTVQTL